jgi:cyclopropane fatty-acyl-phospholipid synthase-like methyltransferase
MLRFIGNQFKKPSGLFGKIVSRIMIKGNRSDYDKIIPELDIKPGERIMEIGYGHGVGIDRISSNYDCFVSGIDFSELMFREATKRNKKHIENNKVKLFFGDILSTEIPVSNLDKVFCVNVIYFWDKLDEPFRRIKTMLKQGGLLCMFMVHRDYLNKIKFTKDGIFNKYTVDEVVDQLKSAGFVDVAYNLDNVGYIIKCRK